MEEQILSKYTSTLRLFAPHDQLPSQHTISCKSDQTAPRCARLFSSNQAFSFGSHLFFLRM